MIRAFWFVTTRSARNRIISRFKRLREPRYLVGFVAGLAYLWFMFFKRVVSHRAAIITMSGRLPTNALVLDVMATCAIIPLLIAWALPDSGGGLTFTEAEIQFLFAGPVSRRQLLVYKFLRQQPQVLVSALMVSVFGFGLNRAPGMYFMFVALSGYFLLVPLARARLRLAGIGFFARLVAVLALLAGVVALFVHELKPLFASANLDLLIKSGQSPFNTPALRILLFVPRLFVVALAPAPPLSIVLHCLALVALTAVFVAIAAQLNVSFEEASLAASARKQSQVDRVRSFRTGNRVVMPRMPPPFRLPANPFPELALLWKNLIAAMRISMAAMVVLMAIFILLAVQAVATNEPVLHATSATIALFLAGLFPLFASNILTQDMRLDLPRIEILKSYPLSGERLVAAEIAAPLLIMSVIEILLLAGTAILINLPNATPTLQRIGTPENVVAALLFAIPICAVQLLIRNAAAILFPGWTMRASDDQRGFAVVGQRLVMFAGNMFVLLVTLLPAAVLFGGTFLLTSHFLHNGVAPLALASVPAAALILGEAWLGVKFLGAQFERIDVTNEMGSAIV